MPPPKTVLYLITKGTWGGASRYVYDLAIAASARGMNVTVAHGGTGELVSKLTIAGIPTISVPGLTRDVGGSDMQAFLELGRIIRKLRPDVLHLNSAKAGGLGALAGRLAGVRTIIFTDHGWAFAEKRSLPSRIVIWLFSWLIALLVNRIIAVSDYELMLTKRMPFVGKKAVRIYNGIDLDMDFGSGSVVRASYPPGAHITGTIGELTKNKNQIALIDKARQDPHLFVAIVGEGELRAALEQKIAEYGLGERVKLFGFIPATDVLKGFDSFALTSTKEALGYVVLEARVAGLPIEANRVGGVSEALDVPLTEFSLEQMVRKTFALY